MKTTSPLQEASNFFHIKMHLTITHAKICFDAHSKMETTHLVLAFGFPQKLLYSIHSLLEALTLVNLYHFLLVSVIRLQLLHFDPSTRNKQTKRQLYFPNSNFLNHHTFRNGYIFCLQSNWWQQSKVTCFLQPEGLQFLHSLKTFFWCFYLVSLSSVIISRASSTPLWASCIFSITKTAFRCDHRYLFRIKAV